MVVKIKKLHPDAVIPSYAKQGDAGQDITAVAVTRDMWGNIVYHTGLAFEVPMGYVGLLFMRSSNFKTDLQLTNAVGVLDSGYRGEVLFKYKPIFDSRNIRNTAQDYTKGDRIGQIVILPYPQIHFEEVDELTESERGTGGYGHTGK